MRWWRNTGLYLVLLVLIGGGGGLPDRASAQDARLRGFVIDGETGEALQGANVVIGRGSDRIRGVATDGDGYFLIEGIPAGTVAIEASFVGYETRTDTLLLAGGELRTIRLGLQPERTLLGELIVETDRRASATAAVAGLEEVRAADLNRIPLPDVAGDLVSFLQITPGVVTSGDRGGQLYIRGGTPTQNLVLIDGIPIYQPFHMIGFFSAFPAEIIHHADIYSGGFDSPFGGRLSSVIDIAARNGNKRTTRASASIAPFLSTLTVEGPLTPDKTSILLSVRESLFERAFPGTLGSLPFVFGDQFVKVHSLVESGQLSITALRTHDRGVVDDTERQSSQLPGSQIPGARTTSIDDEVKWKNGVLGLRYLLLPESVPVLGELTLSYSRVSNSFGTSDVVDRSSRVDNFRASATVTRLISAGAIRWGLSMQNLRVQYSLDGVFQDLDTNDEPNVDAGLFADYSSPIGSRISATFGLHSHLYAGAGWTIEPRARMALQLSPVENRHQLSLAWGLYSQNLIGLRDERDAGDIFTAWVASPIGNDIPRAMHAILGWHLTPSAIVSLDVEAYYRTMSRLAIPAWSPYARFTTTLQEARGRIHGLDVRIEITHPPFYAFVGYGLANVLYTAMQGSFGLWYGTDVANFNPPHDRRHQVNVLTTYTRGKSSLNLQFQFGSGLPFTRPIGFDDWIYFETLVDVAEEPGEFRVLFERPYNGRLPTYHRLDLSVEHTFELPRRSAITLKAGLMNTYNRKNIFYYDVWSLRRVNQMTILPWAGARIDL